MAQEIVTWCDRCMGDGIGERVPGQPLRVALDGAQPLLVDLCERCRKEAVGELSALLDEYGRRIDGGSARGGPAPADPERGALPRKQRRDAAPTEPLECPRCLQKFDRNHLRQHLENTHGVSLATIETELGQTLDGRPLQWECGVCHLWFSHSPGRVSHGRSHHPGEDRKVAEPGRRPFERSASAA